LQAEEAGFIKAVICRIKSTSFAKHKSGDDMGKLKENIILFGLGALAYGLVEVAARGYTHWTMALTGGVVMVILGAINRTRGVHILLKCMLGALVITSLEFCVGMTVNVGLGWGVWDYSEKPLNLWGQICPQFSMAWFFLSVPAYSLCTLLQKRLSLR
jgi:hypothetical protein